MKCVSFLSLVLAVAVVSGDSVDEETENCALFNVTDADSCDVWCGPDEMEWTYLTEHGDVGDLELDYLKGWECHCEGADEQRCVIPYELPTCESVGIIECDDVNANVTCGILCDQVGLGLGGSASRFLSHVTDQHYCAHVELDDEDHEDHRMLSVEDKDEEEHEEKTLCFCNAAASNTFGATVACSDAEPMEHSDDPASLATQTGLLVAASTAAVLAATFVA